VSDDSYSCIADLLFRGEKPDDSIAILAPGYLPVTYGELREQARRTVAVLAAKIDECLEKAASAGRDPVPGA